MRRQLTDEQKVLLGQRIAPDVAETSAAADARWDPCKQCPSDTCRQGASGRSTDEVAALVGLGPERQSKLDQLRGANSGQGAGEPTTRVNLAGMLSARA